MIYVIEMQGYDTSSDGRPVTMNINKNMQYVDCNSHRQFWEAYADDDFALTIDEAAKLIADAWRLHLITPEKDRRYSNVSFNILEFEEF